MLTNSLLAGALGAAFLTIIVLQLNPSIPLLSATTWRLFVALALFYGVHLAVVFYLLMVGREFIGLYGLSPGWMSVRILAWLTAALSAGASVLMWLNVSGFALALGESAVRRMTAGAANEIMAYDRGRLSVGLAADIVVKSVMMNSSSPSCPPPPGPRAAAGL